MKNLLFIIGLFAVVSGSAQSHLTNAVQGFHTPVADTVQPVRFIALDSIEKNGVWDFSSLLPKGAPLISHVQDSLGETILQEGETVFRFDSKTDGNYYKGWEDYDKAVILHEAYNKLPLPFAAGQQHSASYTAAGIFSHSGVAITIEGTYMVEAGAEGKIILPDGRVLCPAILVKTMDKYSETNCNTTEVTIEKYLWYVPYYTFPVFVTAQTIYEYTGGIRDTLQAAYYTINPMPQSAIRSINDTTICIGKTVLLTASGKGQRYWRNLNENTDFTPFADTLLKPVVTTSYVLMAKYDLCAIEAAFDTVTITVISQPAVRSIQDTTICFGQDVWLTATGVGELSWQNMTENTDFTSFADILVAPTITTTYVFKAENAPCIQPALDTVTITVIPQPEVRSIQDTTICFGQDVWLTATGVGELSWRNMTENTDFTSFADILVAPTITTTYVFKAENAPCIQPALDTVTITVIPQPEVRSINDTTVCFGQDILLTATGIGELSWRNITENTDFTSFADILVAPTITTTYVFKAENAPCIQPALDTVTITVIPQPEVRSIQDTTICFGRNVLLTATGVGELSWRNITENTDFSPFAETLVAPIVTTTYVFKAENAPCIQPALDTVTITVIPQPEVRSIQDTTICFGQDVWLTATGVGEFSWRNITENTNFSPFAETLVAPTVTTTYVFKAENAPCIQPALDTVTITVIPQPEVRSINDTTVCFGQDVLLTATGIGELSWRNITENTNFSPFAETLVAPTVTTTYVFKAENAPCLQPAFDTVTIIVKTPPALLLHTNDVTICQGSTVNLQASSDFHLQWYSLDSYSQRIAINDSQVQPEISTRYIAVASNLPCPENAAEVSVTVLPVPQPEFTIIQSGNEVLFDITSPKIDGYNYIFNAGDYSNTAYNLFSILHKYWKRGTYDATLTIASNSNGCERSLSQKVLIEQDKPTDFILYPNPANEFITVIAPSDILYYRIIRISTGTVWGELKRPGNEMALQIPVWQLQQGEYLIQVQTRDEWLSRIFIKLQ
jgi:hypothetical protein